MRDKGPTELTVLVLAGAAEISVVPQSPQNLLSGGFSVPHFGQRAASLAPHLPQNFLSSGFSHLQARQSITDAFTYESC